MKKINIIISLLIILPIALLVSCAREHPRIKTLSKYQYLTWQIGALMNDVCEHAEVSVRLEIFYDEDGRIVHQITFPYHTPGDDDYNNF